MSNFAALPGLMTPRRRSRSMLFDREFLESLVIKKPDADQYRSKDEEDKQDKLHDVSKNLVRND